MTDDELLAVVHAVTQELRLRRRAGHVNEGDGHVVGWTQAGGLESAVMDLFFAATEWLIDGQMIDESRRGAQIEAAENAAGGPVTDDPRWEDLQFTEDDFQMLIAADDDARLPEYRASLRTLHLVAGPLTPEAVVEFARPAGSPLHGAFHWGSDDDVTDQAASMLSAWSDLLRTP